jgi:hypothetical protein
MQLTKEYSWLNSYITSPQFWVEDVLNWDESINLTITDYNLFSLLTSPFMLKTYIYLESFVKLSFLDIMIMSESSEMYELQEFYNAVMWDLYETVQVLFYSFQFIYYTNYQDFFLILLHHSPELTIPLIEFVTTYWDNGVFKFVTAAGSMFFNDAILSNVYKLNNHAALVCISVWFIFIFFYAARLTKWDHAVESYLTRLLTYFNSMSKETRIELEAVLTMFLLFLILLVTNIASFRDWFEEMTEDSTLVLVYIFYAMYIFFIAKVSIHKLAFLEASESKRRTAGLFVQFGKDVTNGVILLLRFLTLLVRLNLYDTVDDVLDSYYIFLCDFQDEMYVTDSSLFCNLCFASFMNDSMSLSRTLLTLYHSNYYLDLWRAYIMICWNFLSFIYFALELIGRVLLAFFILYLVIFEMQSVNRSHVEDEYITNIRKKNLKTIETSFTL